MTLIRAATKELARRCAASAAEHPDLHFHAAQARLNDLGLVLSLSIKVNHAQHFLLLASATRRPSQEEIDAAREAFDSWPASLTMEYGIVHNPGGRFLYTTEITWYGE